jgi:hypothetical protein
MARRRKSSDRGEISGLEVVLGCDPELDRRGFTGRLALELGRESPARLQPHLDFVTSIGYADDDARPELLRRDAAQ